MAGSVLIAFGRRPAEAARLAVLRRGRCGVAAFAFDRAIAR
jgi:hypothetical protein